MKIIKLDSSVYNKISAGEVVERPASVIKELTENAIDAGATKIEILVVNAGLDEIKVIDNGCGIDKDDLKVAFLPHATSKIRRAEDLAEIKTLGFRGEALPSIASVSMVEIKSKTADSDVGNTLVLRGGEVVEEGIASMNNGTEITVSNLFFNTPARLKFLKTPSGELSEIKSTVLKLIFANPTISITLYDKNQKIYLSDGPGLASAIKSIFSEEIWQNLIPVNYEKNGIYVGGYVSRSNYFKMNRTYQISIVNGRVCDNQNISSAISTVYAQYLMKRNYPVTVLSIDLSPTKIDVNVHPTKAEVRFSDGNQVFSAVYHAIKNAVEGDIEARRIQFDTIKDEAEQPIEDSTTFVSSISYAEILADNAQVTEEAINPIILPFANHSHDADEFREESEIERSIKDNYRKMREKGRQKQVELPETQEMYRVIGQVFGTYLLLEQKDRFIIVDQHAAVERLRYDKLLAAYRDGNIAVQPLLYPLTIEVNPAEYQIVESKIPALKKIGVELVPFGNDSFKLASIPDILSEVDINVLIKHILSDRLEKEEAVIEERLAYAACRSSIKGNTYLTADQIDELMKVYFKDGLPVQCPHGRPVYHIYTKRDLETLFKRIV